MSRKLTIQDIKDAVEEVYVIKDKGIIDLLMGFTLANRSKRKEPAIWLILLGGSSSGKTIMLQLLSKCGPWVVPVDTLTTNTFASAFQSSSESSLLKQANFGILVFKDFTTITSMNQEALREIMGQLRAIYDGEFVKRVGNNNPTLWVGKVGVLGAGTIDVQRKMRQYSKNGERFLNYSPIVASANEIANRSLSNQENIKEKEAELATLVAEFINQKLGENFVPEFNFKEDFKDEIVAISDLCTLARSPVDMNFKNPAIVDFVGEREMPGRMAAMLRGLGLGIMWAKGETRLTIDIAKILYKVALDSIPVERKMVLTILAKYNSATTRNIAIKLHLPTVTVLAWLNQINALKMVDRSSGGERNSDLWVLKKEYKDILQEYMDIEGTDNNLDVSDEEIKNAYIDEEDMPEAPEVLQKEGIKVPIISNTISEQQKMELNDF